MATTEEHQTSNETALCIVYHEGEPVWMLKTDGSIPGIKIAKSRHVQYGDIHHVDKSELSVK